ncbi:MAG: sodium:solute symporter family protein [Myxococcota bacterium]
MSSNAFAWVVFGVYIVATTLLALRGMRKTQDLAGFAIGGGNMGPILVGVTLAAAVSSTATFVINPGFVFKDGLAALLHFGVAGYGGVIAGLLVLSKGFRRIGSKVRALTLPHWVGARYESPGLRTYFGLLNLVLAVTFCVLIVKGSALVMQHTLGLGYGTAVFIIVGFVFTYILLGGTYAHAYTNALQGSIMAVVALLIFGSGLGLLFDEPGLWSVLAEQDPNLVKVVNPSSALFSSAWQIFVCGFVVSFGLVCQPHILTKSLYLRRDEDHTAYLVVAGIVGTSFTLMLVVGLWARARFPEIPSQDAVIAVYIAKSFTPYVGAFVSVALLAAGMSTMDGLLVSASTIAGNDIFLGFLGERLMPGASMAEREKAALRASQGIIAFMGVSAFFLALDPPQLVGLFAQMGVYGVVCASIVPMTAGILLDRPSRSGVKAAAVAGPLVHFTHYGSVFYGYGQPINPALTATEGVIASVAIYVLISLLKPGQKDSSASL